MAPSTDQFPLFAWFVFGAALLVCVAVDLILHRGSRQRSRSAAITWTGARASGTMPAMSPMMLTRSELVGTVHALLVAAASASTGAPPAAADPPTEAPATRRTA